MFPTSNKHVKYWCFGGGSKTRDRFFVLQKTSREFLGTEIMQWAKMQQPVSENVTGCFQYQGGKHIKWTCGVKNWSAIISYSIIPPPMLDFLLPIHRSSGFAAGLTRSGPNRPAATIGGEIFWDFLAIWLCFFFLGFGRWGCDGFFDSLDLI